MTKGQNNIHEAGSGSVKLSHASKIGTGLLYAGIFLIVATFLVYLIFSQSSNDFITSFWLTSMMGGVLLIILSQLVEWKRNNFER